MAGGRVCGISDPSGEFPSGYAYVLPRPGMTQRTYIATNVLTSMVSAYAGEGVGIGQLARDAVAYTDALLAELAK